MSTTTRTFVLGGVIALPVGHRVEVTTYAREEGIFTKASVPQPGEPLVRDLDTGVVYGRRWHFREDEMFLRDAEVPRRCGTTSSSRSGSSGASSRAA